MHCSRAFSKYHCYGKRWASSQYYCQEGRRTKCTERLRGHLQIVGVDRVVVGRGILHSILDVAGASTIFHHVLSAMVDQKLLKRMTVTFVLLGE